MSCQEIIMNTYMVNERFGIIHEEQIQPLADQCGLIAATVKKHLKALNCVIYKQRPPKIRNIDRFHPHLEQLT